MCFAGLQFVAVVNEGDLLYDKKKQQNSNLCTKGMTYVMSPSRQKNWQSFVQILYILRFKGRSLKTLECCVRQRFLYKGYIYEQCDLRRVSGLLYEMLHLRLGPVFVHY